MTRSRELTQAKSGGPSGKTHSFFAFSVINPVPIPLLYFRVTEVKGDQKGSVALRETW